MLFLSFFLSFLSVTCSVWLPRKFGLCFFFFFLFSFFFGIIKYRAELS